MIRSMERKKLVRPVWCVDLAARNMHVDGVRDCSLSLFTLSNLSLFPTCKCVITAVRFMINTWDGIAKNIEGG